MEIIKEDKLAKCKHILKKFYNTNISNPKQANTIEDKLDTNHPLQNTDSRYLEGKNKQIDSLQTPKPDVDLQKSAKRNEFEKELKMIEQLHQKEIGDFSRLESIRNYLIDGMPLLHEDSVYLSEQYNQLRKVIGIKKEFEGEKTAKKRTAPLKPQAILIDDVEETPTHDFDSLSKTISNIIKNSTPHFTIGIYGEWGTGKTTLMKSIEKNLSNANIQDSDQSFLPIWFNAWKYEREENLATVSLMMTVGYAMDGHEVFDPLSKTIFKGLTIVGKDVMQQIAMQAVSKNREVSDTEIEEKISHLNKLYRDSVYYDGLDRIRKQMESIREEKGDYRVVIFIDDLDRCSPVKALEVLESIKLFLDMEGFIFVIGLSHKTVTQLISQAYQLTGIKGDDYIKKIIQIPIKIPSWSKESIINLINTTITTRLNSDYTRFLSQNSAMIAKVVDYNPRQLKRFINNVIIAFETFAGKQGSPEIHFNEIFLVKILKAQWPDFYREFVNNKDFRDIVKWMIVKPRELRKYFSYLRTLTEELPVEQRAKRILLLSRLAEISKGSVGSHQIDLLADFDNDAWVFFDNVKDVLFGIDNWKVVDNVMDVVEEFSFDFQIGSKKPAVQENQVTQQKQVAE